MDPPADRTSATYLAAILVDRRDDAVERLGRAGIETGVHYRRNDHHPLFGEPRDLPGAPTSPHWVSQMFLKVGIPRTRSSKWPFTLEPWA